MFGFNLTQKTKSITNPSLLLPAPQSDYTYGYNAKGNYVGKDGYFDKNGLLEEID